MTITINPEDVTVPAGWDEEQVQKLIDTTMSYVYLIAPNVDSLEGHAETVATDLCLKLVNENAAGQASGGVTEYSSGPFSFTVSTEALAIYGALRRLCGQDSGRVKLTKLRSTSLSDCLACYRPTTWCTCVEVSFPYSRPLDLE